VTLGWALVLIFILYLIDKHRLWRSAAKIGVGLVVLVIISGAGFYGWTSYRDKKQVAAENAKNKKINECIDRLTDQKLYTKYGAVRLNSEAVMARVACEESPDALPPGVTEIPVQK
jgi:hypothetical protein